MSATCRLALVGVALVATLAVSLGSWTSPRAAEAQEALYRVQGTVTDPEGKPIGRLFIGLDGHGESWGARHPEYTEADGTFSFEVPEGTYRLVTTTAFASECMVEGYENPKSGWEVTIAVGDGDIAGIQVTASGSRSGPPGLVHCSFPEETLGHIKGTVTDEAGQPVEGLWITANVHRSTGVYGGEHTASDGTFHLRLRHGVYWLHIHTESYNECTVSGYDAPGARGSAIFDTGDGDVAGLQVVVSGSSSESKVWSRCKFDTPLPRIEGTLLGPDGTPEEGVHIRAWGEHEPDTFGPWTGPATTSTGAFSVEVPDGRFGIEFFVALGDDQCRLGYVGGEGSHTHTFPFDDRITVEGEDVKGIVVQLPNTRSDLCRPIRGLVTDPDGNPFRTWIAAAGIGPLAGIRANLASQANGPFTLYSPAGSYYLRVSTRAGSACTVVGSPTAEPGRQARIEVGDNGASGIRVIISGEPSSHIRVFSCYYPPRMLTTKLQPGWNLAGWTGDEGDAAGLFGAIAGLEVVHAWDTEGGRFLSAFHGAPDEANSLRVLTPGMGLWLYVGGTDSVEWTRPLLPESGFVTLAEGWNLVSWSGEDSVAVDEAVAGLSAELTAAAARDAETGQALHYAPTAPATDNTLQRIAHGSAFWIEMSRDRPWLQPGSAQPRIEYVSEIPADAQASLPSEIESAITYFAHRFGIFVPGMQYVIGEHPTVCGGYASLTIYLEEPCLRAIAHEYSHAIQEHLAGPASSPAWITEGVANRWSAEYYDATGDRSYSDHINTVVLPNSRLTPIPLREMETTLFIHDFASPNYNVAHLAIDRLIALAGGDLTFEYYSRRGSYETWQEAFEAVFGISAEDFYASFEAHRAQAAPQLPQITGTVLDDEGNPMTGTRLRAKSRDGQPSAWATAGEDGSFSMKVHEGSYRLEVHTLEGEEAGHAGWYTDAGGFTSQRSEATTILVASDDITGITVRVPELTWYRIKGVVRGPAGDPLEGILVDAVPKGEYAAFFAYTDENGEFSIPVLGGRHYLHLRNETPEGLRTIGWYGRGSGFSPLREERRAVDARGRDVTGITVRFPVDPAPSQWRRIEGVVLGPGGEPQEGIDVDAYPVGATPGLDGTTDETGAFSIWVLPGPFTLHLRADTPDGRRRIGFYGGEDGFAPLERDAGVVEVGSTDLSGITINLPRSYSGE